MKKMACRQGAGRGLGGGKQIVKLMGGEFFYFRHSTDSMESTIAEEMNALNVHLLV